MPPPSRPSPTSDELPPEPKYPQIEGYVERASAEEIGLLFGQLREQLGSLKGPRAEQAKKVTKAIGRTEELLLFLLEVREKLETERNGGPKDAPKTTRKK